MSICIGSCRPNVVSNKIVLIDMSCGKETRSRIRNSRGFNSHSACVFKMLATHNSMNEIAAFWYEDRTRGVVMAETTNDHYGLNKGENL